MHWRGIAKEANALTEREIAIRAARAADEKKAEDVVVLDMADLTVLTDYFVICSGATNAEVRAIIEAVDKSLAEVGWHPRRREGRSHFPLGADGLRRRRCARLSPRGARLLYDLEVVGESAAARLASRGVGVHAGQFALACRFDL